MSDVLITEGKPRIVVMPTAPYDAVRAADAYEAHTAMVSCEAARPGLANNPAWAVLRDIAFRQFERAYGAAQ